MEFFNRSSRFIIVILVLVSCIVQWYGVFEGWNVLESHVAKWGSSRAITVFTEDDLQQDTNRILLSITGVVFDVSTGAKHYGEGGGYAMLARGDVSRAYGTGDMSPAGLTDDLAGLTPAECLGIQSYVDFFEKHATYRRVGVLVGRHFSPQGEALQPYLDFEDCVTRGQKEAKDAPVDERCTYVYKRGRGSRLSCDVGTNGGTRVPRQFNYIQQDKTVKEKCLCLPLEDAMSRTDGRVYTGCAPESSTCTFPDERHD